MSGFLIPFVSESKVQQVNNNRVAAKVEKGNLEGAEAKAFYDSVVSSQSDSTSTLIKTSSKVRSALKRSTKSTSNGSNLVSSRTSIHKLAQEGNLECLQKCVENGCFVDEQDYYGWTPLMCAACEGHVEVVDFLLRSGANRTILCKYGMSALDIAEKKKNATIIALLKNGPVHNYKKNPERNKFIAGEEMFCEICQISHRVPKSVHEKSIPHLLSSNSCELPTFYYIPECNKGFQIMLKCGWNKKGLGPNAEGRKFPIKTVFKQDRACIGRKKEVPRVSHFDAGDINAVNGTKKNIVHTSCGRKLKKQEMQRKQLEDRNKEITFRREFYDLKSS